MNFIKHLWDKAWLYISSAITFIALFLYAMLQRNKKKQAENKAERKEKAQQISRDVDKAVQEQRQENVDNEQQMEEDISNRNAGLNNDRLRNK